MDFVPGIPVNHLPLWSLPTLHWWDTSHYYPSCLMFCTNWWYNHQKVDLKDEKLLSKTVCSWHSATILYGQLWYGAHAFWPLSHSLETLSAHTRWLGSLLFVNGPPSLDCVGTFISYAGHWVLLLSRLVKRTYPLHNSHCSIYMAPPCSVFCIIIMLIAVLIGVEILTLCKTNRVVFILGSGPILCSREH